MKSRQRPKTPAIAKLRPNLRALKALGEMMDHWRAYIRWVDVQRNCPPLSAIHAKAGKQAAAEYERYYRAMNTVRRALGEDPDADEPQPARHWDAGA